MNLAIVELLLIDYATSIDLRQSIYVIGVSYLFDMQKGLRAGRRP